jgi:hypothetical protein
LFPFINCCEKCCNECGSADIFNIQFSFSWNIYSIVGLLEYMVVLLLIFSGTSMLFSSMVVLICIPPTVCRDSLFSTQIYYLAILEARGPNESYYVKISRVGAGGLTQW